MQRYYPQYYECFKCIADKCKHSCCIGWEIDIDKATYNYYKSIKGEFGEKLINSIAKTDCPHFINTDNGRCPHLNENNLCNIILTLGGNALCDICNLHPRFINDFETVEEIGLGLCCEEAARLILSEKDKFYLKAENDKDASESKSEQSFFRLRGKILDALQDRGKNIETRIVTALSLIGEEYKEHTAKEFYNILMPLERLDNDWEVYLNNLCNPKVYSLPKDFNIIAEQLLCYFVYRHFSIAFKDGLYAERLMLCIKSYDAIKCIAEHTPNMNAQKIIDIARGYSSEVEYSDKNLERLLAKFIP